MKGVLIFLGVLVIIILLISWKEYKNAQKSIRANEENGKEQND